MAERGGWGRRAAVLVLAVLAFLTFYPYLFILVNSTKTIPQFYRDIWLPVWPIHWENYGEAWSVIRGYIANSILVSASSTALALLLATPTAFVFARYAFPGRRLLFVAILSLMMVPWILTLVPAFLLVRRLGLLDTYWVMILPYAAGGQVFAIFVLRIFFAGMPEELFASARVDGAGDWGAFRHIALPLARPVIGAVAVMQVLWSWNNLIWPLVTVSGDARSVITRGLYVFGGRYAQRYGAMFAGYTISSLPLLLVFVFTARLFLKGMAAGALKG